MRLQEAPHVGDARARRVGVNWPTGDVLPLGPHPSDGLLETLVQVGLTPLSTPQPSGLFESLAAAAAANPDRPLVLCAGDLELSPIALLDLVDVPADRTAALTIDATAVGALRTVLAPLRVSAPDRRLLSAGSSRHTVTNPTCHSVGVLRIRAADRARAAEIWRSHTGGDRAAAEAATSTSAFDLGLLGLVRGGLEVVAVPLGPYSVARGPDRIAGAPGSPWQQRLRGASRGNDGAFSTAVVRPLSRRVTAVGLRHGWVPNAVTVVSLLLGLTACGLAAVDDRIAWIVAALLLQASLVADCVDGEIARFTRRYSALGGWLDAVSDRVKEFTLVAAVAWVAARRGEPLWTLAIGVLALLAIRHIEDYAYTRRARALAAGVSPDLLGIDVRHDLGPRTARTTVPPPPTGPARLARTVKQVLHLPIAERYLIMSVGLLAFSPALLLWALLVALAIALLWTQLGRTLRALGTRDGFDPTRADPQLAPLLDVGVLGRVLGRPAALLGRSRFGWQAPWLVLAIEALVVVLVLLPEPPADRWPGYLWLAAVCWHRYDLIYRLRETGRGSAPWLQYVTLGAPARAGLLAAGWLLGWSVPALLLVGGLVLTVAYAAESAAAWSVPPGPSRPSRRQADG